MSILRLFAGFVGLLLLAGCGYSHIATTVGTFRQDGDRVVLTLRRDLDTVMRGSDMEETQWLVLELPAAAPGKRYTLPSAEVAARFSAQRFGPTSEGREFVGTVAIESIGSDKVVADLSLVVTARTVDGRLVHKAKYRGDHTFFREKRR